MTSTWSSGYITELEYIFGYYPEINPNTLRLACLLAGYQPPIGESFSYLELGFGQGVSINFHAAAFPGSFWGTDINPVHAAGARVLARASGSDVVLEADSFEELLARPDLPEFDAIVLHGIWTWISDDVRRSIVDIVRRKLKLGGLLYNSYNSFPGWAPTAPVRHLMSLYARTASGPAEGILKRLDGALGFCRQVVDAGSNYFKMQPLVVEQIKTMLDNKPKNYVAHEYLNDHWDVVYFSQMVDWLEPAKVTFATTANLLDHIDLINIAEEGRKLLKDLADPVLRETVRDYLVAQRFRRDIFIKGPTRLTAEEQLGQLKQQSFVLAVSPLDISMTAMGASGEVSLEPTIYRPLIQALAEDGYRPKSVDELLRHPSISGVATLEQLVQALVILAGMRRVHPTHATNEETRRRCAALNWHICERARQGHDSQFLVSAQTGMGIVMSRIEKLFLQSVVEGRTSPAEQASDAWRALLAKGQRIISKDGTPLETPEENLAALNEQAADFQEKRLPLLKALGVELRHA